MTDLSTMIQNLRLGANIPPPAKLRNFREGLASIYVFETRPPNAGGAVVFRYDVEITDIGRGKSLTSGATDDGKKHLLRNICFELVNAVNKATQGFGSQALFVYDNRKNLFTNKPIKGDSLTYEVAPDHMTEHTRAFLRSAQVRVEIKPCQTERFELDLNDLGSSLCARPDQQSDHAVRTFLEMLTSQTFINAGTHDVIGMGRLFERKIVKRLEDGVVTRFGLAKGVRIIDNDGRPKPALVADVKTCAFFANETLARIVQDMMDKRRIDMNRKDHMERFTDDFNGIFRGVSGYLTYAPSRIIVIDALSQRPMSEISLEVDGRRMSMVDFFAQKKNVRVDGRFPAVRQQQDRDTLFPMECIVILPSQGISIEKMAQFPAKDFISRELLNANTTPPERRYADIEAELKRIATGDSAAFMGQFGVKLVGGRNTVKIGVHDPIKVKFAGLEAAFQDRINPAVRFLEPSNVLKNWVVAYSRSVRDNEARDFVEQVMRMGKNRGMNLLPPNYHGGIEQDHLADRMQQLASNHVQFMLYIDKKIVKSHSVLKLNEKRVGLLTQHVTLEVANKARAMTLSNVLNKMNMKLFGYNYMPILPPEVKNKFPMDAGEVLVIGVDTSRPPRCTGYEKYMMKKRGLEEGLQSEDPMIVGVCANYLKNPYKFCGDYYYQPCKQDVLEPNALLSKIGWVLQKMMHFRNKLPSIIFIIRDGVSEGMVPNNVRNEFPAYPNACRVFNQNWNPKFVYCIVDKKHNKRFFVRGQNKVENTMPGHVIDSKVTRVDLHEFWLQSHVPLKGTSKVPQYMFPVNQINANNNELQGFLLAMCCNWQIVNLAPALPTPVRQASELAKRGRNNYVELKQRTPQHIPRLPGTQQINYQALNARLCYNGHTFANTRFNA